MENRARGQERLALEGRHQAITGSGADAGTGAGDSHRSWRGAQDTGARQHRIQDRAGVAELRHVLYNYHPGGMGKTKPPPTTGGGTQKPHGT